MSTYTFSYLDRRDADAVMRQLPGLELQAEAARQGYGTALLPCIMGGRDPALIRVPGTGTYDTLPAGLPTHPDLRRMKRVRVFAGMFAKAIGAQSDKACRAQLAASG